MDKKRVLACLLFLILAISVSYWYFQFSATKKLEFSTNSLGWQLYREGKYESAILEFDRSIERFQDNPYAYLGRGWSQYSLYSLINTSNPEFKIGKLEEATSSFEKAYNLDQTMASAYYGMATVQAQIESLKKTTERNYSSAWQNIEKALSLNSTNPLYLKRKAALLLEESKIEKNPAAKIEESISLYNGVLLYYPNDIESYMGLGFANHLKKNYSESIRLNSYVLHLGGGNIPSVLSMIGRSYFAIGNYSMAMTYFNLSSDLAPDAAINYGSMGWISIEQGNYQDTKKFFIKSIEHYPYSDQPHLGLGIINYYSKEYEGAIKELQTAIDLNPFGELSGISHAFLGLAYYQTKNYERAEKEFLLLISSDESFPSFISTFGIIKTYNAQSNNMKANEYLPKLEYMLNYPDSSLEVKLLYKLFKQCVGKRTLTAEVVSSCTF